MFSQPHCLFMRADLTVRRAHLSRKRLAKSFLLHISPYISTCQLAQPLLKFWLQGPLGAVSSSPLTAPPAPAPIPISSHLDANQWCVWGVLRYSQTNQGQGLHNPSRPRTSLSEVQFRISSREASLAHLLSVSPGRPGREKVLSLLSFCALSLPFLVDFPNLRPRSWEGPGASHSELTPL